MGETLQFGQRYELAKMPNKRALESLDTIDYLGLPDGRYGDQYGRWYPISQPTPVFGSRNSRQYGRDRYSFWTEQQLLVQRDAARFLADNDPLALGMVGQLMNFTVGSSPQVIAVPKKLPGKTNEANGRQAAELVQKRIDAFTERMAVESGYTTTFSEYCREYCHSSVVDGEKWDRIFCTRQGAVVRRIEPEQVTQPPGGTDPDGWHLGVRCEPGDVQKRLGYWITYEPGMVRGEYVEARDVVFLKRNTPSTAVRGVSDFLSVTDDMADVGRLVDGIRVGAKVRSKIAYIRSFKGITQSNLEGWVGAQQDTQPTAPNSTPGAGRPMTRETLPPGSVVNAGDVMEIKIPGQGAIDEYINAANFAIRLLAARWQLQEFMANADASNNNYASLLAAAGPTVKAFEAQQEPIAVRLRMIIVRALEYDIALGFLPVGILEAVEVDVKLPSPAMNDPLATATINQMLVMAGVKAKSTWQTEVNLDPEEENQKILMEREQMGAMVQPLPEDGNTFGSEEQESGDNA